MNLETAQMRLKNMNSTKKLIMKIALTSIQKMLKILSKNIKMVIT